VFFRLGYGFSRQRNGALNMHSATSIAAVIGAWNMKAAAPFIITALFTNGASR
jgi:anaerobic selenocysteine-containing dehydrogenase